ncbi:hypothetical protein ACFV0T_37965 [Streptomyces sp. NPDC059582]|uniref:hypothetical protein n=1 Tax=Streptomyces sp. NPDC059582 TaxID=3346875 RepID=UPI003699A4D5
MPADFGARLAHDDRADGLLDLALARLKEVGLVRERNPQRTSQRTGSTHVLAAVRNLTYWSDHRGTGCLRLLLHAAG